MTTEKNKIAHKTELSGQTELPEQTKFIFPRTEDNIVSFVASNNNICMGKIASEDSLGILFESMLVLQMFEEEGKVKFVFAPLAVGCKDPKNSKTYFPYSSIMCFYEMEESLLKSFRDATGKIQIVSSINKKY